MDPAVGIQDDGPFEGPARRLGLPELEACQTQLEAGLLIVGNDRDGRFECVGRTGSALVSRVQRTQHQIGGSNWIGNFTNPVPHGPRRTGASIRKAKLMEAAILCLFQLLFYRFGWSRLGEPAARLTRR